MSLRLKDIELLSRGAKVRTLVCLIIKSPSSVTILLHQVLDFTKVRDGEEGWCVQRVMKASSIMDFDTIVSNT